MLTETSFSDLFSILFFILHSSNIGEIMGHICSYLQMGEVLLNKGNNMRKSTESQILMHLYRGFPGGSDGKESTCKAGDLSSIPGLGRSPGEGHGNPLLYSCLEKPHGQRATFMGL